VAFLKKTQLDDGSWPASPPIQAHHAGLAALPGLTLLECGVWPDDSQVQKAAQHVRDAAPSLNWTYDLALGILFLDRLGEPADRALIQTLALRLLAGQREDGGWSYHCPVLDSEDQRNLLTVMRSLQKESPLHGGIAGAGGPSSPSASTTPPRSSLQGGVAGADSPSSTSGATPAGSPSAAGGAPAGLGSAMPLPTREEADRARRALPPPLKRLPVLNDPGKSQQDTRKNPNDRRKAQQARSAGSDNSNTQFAILGVWVASRHQVPTERALAHIARRFRTSQEKDGGWGYHSGQGGSPAMTGAGLLGLAVGLGLASPQEAAPHDTRDSPPRDGDVEKGLRRLAESIGKPLGAQGPARPARRRGASNTYFLWTVERVGVMYNLRHIAGKDWYHWGAELLVDAQEDNGSWTVGGYYQAGATTDTSFALLFLKRANLAKDLSKRLEFVIDVKGASQEPAGAQAGQPAASPR
jgi:hypothetical protein